MEDTKDRLIQIMETYNIGKKPLAKLLGWGETTVMNQLKGAATVREFAEKLDLIVESPYAFADILETNKAQITEVAYKKAKKAVEERILKDKAIHIIMFLMKYANGDVAPYQLIATLFYAQAARIVLKSVPLFDEDVSYKPRNLIPYPGLYAKLTKPGEFRYTKSVADILSAEDREMIIAIHKVLSGYSPNAVKALLKNDRGELVKHHVPNPETDTDATVITLSEFQEYFVKVKDAYELHEVYDLKTYFDAKLKGGKKNTRTGDTSNGN